jgi:hypothetical protein
MKQHQRWFTGASPPSVTNADRRTSSRSIGAVIVEVLIALIRVSLVAGISGTPSGNKPGGLRINLSFHQPKLVLGSKFCANRANQITMWWVDGSESHAKPDPWNATLPLFGGEMRPV